MKLFQINATTIPDAWFQTIDLILQHGRRWTITQGSYVGQERIELDYLTLHIKHPGVRPLLPEIPPGLGIPAPVDQDYIDQYLPYLLTTEVKELEEYSYGSRLVPQMEEIIKRFKKNGGGSNQETISISQPSDIHLDDPPCLRSLSCRIYTKKCLKKDEPQALHFIMAWRSWDAFNGLPANLAGFRMVQEYMADEIGVEAGEIIACSHGCHIYGHAEDVARIRTARS
jgi:thymidylate synthase